MTTGPEEFIDVDVADWYRVHEEPLGTKPKRWLQDPSSGRYWLMKDVTFNRRADGSAYAKGDDWAERIACEVAGHLDLPIATVELAHDSAVELAGFSVISLSVLGEGESLIHGNELLEEVGVSGTDPHDRTGYTLEAVRRSLDGVGPPDGWEMWSTWEVFVGYLVLDALIGNTDRHQENWAVIASGSGRRLAPTFDHASCLGFQLGDEQRLERLATVDANRTPESYAAKAPSRFEGGRSPLNVAVEALESLTTGERRRWFERFAESELLVGCINRVPRQRMSQPSRDFAERLLHWNHSQLSHAFATV